MTPPTRIVSLVPSATEIVGLLGAADRLVGRSHECDFPDAALRAAVLTSQTTAPGTGAEIDAAVRQSLAAGNPLYRLDTDALRLLRPDLIITQDLCAVCSIDLDAVRAAAAALDHEPVVLSLNPTTIDGVLDDVLRVGQALGLSDEALRQTVRLRERMHAAAEHVNPYVEGPLVAFLEWTDPLYVAGHWVPQLIERAGGRHPLNPTAPRPGSGAAAGPQQAERIAGKSRVISAEALVAAAPDAIIISPCGMNLEATRSAAESVARAPWWGELPAVRHGRVALVDGNQMFSRPGPRLADAFGWLVGWLHDLPALIPHGFPWEPYPGTNSARHKP